MEQEELEDLEDMELEELDELEEMDPWQLELFSCLLQESFGILWTL